MGYIDRNMVRQDMLFLLLAVSCYRVESGWVDPDTSSKFSSTVALAPGDDREYQLVSCAHFFDRVDVRMLRCELIFRIHGVGYLNLFNLLVSFAIFFN